MGDELLYLNGRVMPLAKGRVPVEDRGFQLGDGVYEVVKVMNGRGVWLEDHLDRLHASLGAIGMPQALQGHHLEEVLPSLVEEGKVVSGFLYVQVTRGVHPRDFALPERVEPTVLAYARSMPVDAPDVIEAGAVLHPVEDVRWGRCDIKSIGLLAAVMAKDEAMRAGADEALFVGSDGLVREGGSANVFAVLGGVLRTHPADRHILNGITRQHLIELAVGAGIEVREKAFTLTELLSEDGAEMFLASTLRDVLPVVRVGNRTVSYGQAGAVTLELAQRFRRLQAVAAGLQPPGA